MMRVPERSACRGVRSVKLGFTLIEILVVGALIALFAEMAIISVQTFYDDASRKAMFAESREIATALSFAHDDLGYYPRIYTLGKPRDLVAITDINTSIRYLRPGFDTYGYLPAFTPEVDAVYHAWAGPYAGVTANRSPKTLVKMRLTDDAVNRLPATVGALNGENLQVVLWPTDKWRNPWMLYAVTTDPAVAAADPTNNPLGLRLINSPREEAYFLNAVVSVGPNHVPGGRDQTEGRDLNYYNTVLGAAALYIQGDVVQGGDADFTLKSFTSSFGQTPAGDTRLYNTTTFNRLLAQSIQTGNPDQIHVGIKDSGSDDIYISF
jgi:hypothetical protein